MSIAKRSGLARTLGRIAEEIPGYGALRGAVLDALLEKQDAILEEFLETTIGGYLEVGNFEAVALYIQQNAEEPWLRDGLLRGFQEILDAIDELSRKCLMMLAADYLKMKAVPDRVYKQYARLFTEVDTTTLSPLLNLTDAIFEIGSQRIVIATGCAKDGEPGYYATAKDWSPRFFASQDIRWLIDDLISVLVRNRFLSDPSALGSVEDFPPDFQSRRYVAIVAEHQRGAWERLRGYLAPVRQA